MTPNFSKLIAETVQTLPVDEQEEIYHFAEFIRTKEAQKPVVRRSTLKRKSVFDLFGKTVAKVTDASVNHDKYLYE
ncbi:MAG: DUF2281 domain-containing protein [Fibrobacteres bacterium]|nr:DUF2281 domain-containing protein [Fibrobacterota bacterium]